jgi:hypothetical protein
VESRDRPRVEAFPNPALFSAIHVMQPDRPPGRLINVSPFSSREMVTPSNQFVQCRTRWPFDPDSKGHWLTWINYIVAIPGTPHSIHCHVQIQSARTPNRPRLQVCSFAVTEMRMLSPWFTLELVPGRRSEVWPELRCEPSLYTIVHSGDGLAKLYVLTSGGVTL